MKYVLKTTDGEVYNLNFGNYFLKVLSKNRGVDFTKSTEGLMTEYGKLFNDDMTYNQDAGLTPFLDELVYIVQAAIQAANAEQGVFEKMDLPKVEFMLLDKLGAVPEAFTKYAEIVVKVVEAINPEGLGRGDAKQKKSAAGKRKSASKK